MEKPTYPRNEAPMTPQEHAEIFIQTFKEEGGLESVRKFISKKGTLEKDDIFSIKHAILRWFDRHKKFPLDTQTKVKEHLEAFAEAEARSLIDQENRRRQQQQQESTEETEDLPVPPLAEADSGITKISDIPAIARGASGTGAAHYVDPTEDRD